MRYKMITKFLTYKKYLCASLQWRHNERDGAKSPAPRLYAQLFVEAQIKENIKAPHHGPLRGEFNVDRWIPHTKSQ